MANISSINGNPIVIPEVRQLIDDGYISEVIEFTQSRQNVDTNIYVEEGKTYGFRVTTLAEGVNPNSYSFLVMVRGQQDSMGYAFGETVMLYTANASGYVRVYNRNIDNGYVGEAKVSVFGMLSYKALGAISGYRPMINSAVALNRATGGTNDVGGFPLQSIVVVGTSMATLGGTGYPSDTNGVGTYVTFGNHPDQDSLSGVSQLFMSDTVIAFRKNNGSTWTDWMSINPSIMELEYVHGFGGAINDSNYTDYFSSEPDLNDAPINTVMLCSGTWYRNADHNPNGTEGALITLCGRHTTGRVQVHVSRYGDAFYRISWGSASNPTWTEWRKVLVDGAVGETDFCDVSMFERIGVIGDSYAAGAIHFADTDTGLTDRSLAWGAQLAKQHGCEYKNYAVGGWGSYDFIYGGNTTYGITKLISDMESENYCGVYFICYGINDSNPSFTFGDRSGGPTYLGSSADVNAQDYTQNANSFWGNMSRIISTIKDKSPHSMIVLTTLARFGTSRYDDYSAEIPNIAAYNGVRYITLTEDPFFNSSYYQQLVNNHPTAPLHAGMARAIGRLMSRDMMEGLNYYQNYRGINNFGGE